MNLRKLIPLALPLVGGLNWGLIAIARFDLVAALTGNRFGQTNLASRAVYGVVGLASVYAAAELVRQSTGGSGGNDEVGSGGRAPKEKEGTRSGSPHTGMDEGHPAGPGERSDRDVGGPTSPDRDSDGDATGGAPGTSPGSGFEPHE